MLAAISAASIAATRVDNDGINRILLVIAGLDPPSPN
jgi:hypothetical protein